MPRPAKGIIETHAWKDGRTVTFRARVPFNGRRPRITLGTNHEGWNAERANVELERIMGQVERGTWRPPEASDPGKESADLDTGETIHITLSRWWQRKKKEVEENTKADYQWRLDHILAFRHDTPTTEIDERWVDELREHLAAQPARNRKKGETLAPSSVNKILGALAQALDLAVDHKLLLANPARGKRRKMKVTKSKGAFLEPDMVLDLFEVAGEWEKELRARKRPGQCYGRRSLLVALCLCGPRISEALDADVGHFDRATGLWRIPDAKTPAGVRLIEASAYAAAEIRAHMAQKHVDGRETGAHDPMWITSKGTRLRAGNVRRMLRGVVKRANEKREAEGKMLLPHVTPHTLRRTFACLCFWAGRELPWVMDQIGHDDSRMTVEVYASASRRHRVDRGCVWALMRFADEAEDRPGYERNSPTKSPTLPQGASGQFPAIASAPAPSQA